MWYWLTPITRMKTLVQCAPITKCKKMLFSKIQYCTFVTWHYNDVTMGTIASQITSLTIVDSTVYSDADQRKRQSSASLAFVLGIHRGTVNSPHKWPVAWKMFPFDDVIMVSFLRNAQNGHPWLNGGKIRGVFCVLKLMYVTAVLAV